MISLSQNFAFVRTALQTEQILHSYLNVIKNQKLNNEDAAEEVIIITNHDSDNEESFTKSEFEDTKKFIPKEKKPEEQLKSSQKKRFVFNVADDTTYTCHLCPKRFLRKEHLMLHLNAHKKNKSYQCDSCLKKFNLKHNLLRHQLIHDDKKNFACEVCGKGN